MQTKSASITVRIEPEIKSEAEDILNQLGIPVSTLINSLYRQIIINHGIPFQIRTIPIAKDEMSKEEFQSMLKLSIQQAESGQTKPDEEVFKRLDEMF